MTKNNSLKNRLWKLVEGAIPFNIDRTDDGEFIIESYYPDLELSKEKGVLVNGENLKVDYDENGNANFKDKETKKQLGYFLNEDCIISFRIRKGKIQAYYYGDGDNEYHFDINVEDSMSDEELRTELIKGFSKKFGWIELFEEDKSEIKGVDSKFWVAFYFKNKRKVLEVDRAFFEQNIKSDEESEKGFEDEDDSEEYDKLCDMSVNLASKHFGISPTDTIWAEFIISSKRDIEECTFLSVRLIELN